MSPRLLPAILLAYILICEGFRIPLHLQHLDQRVLEKIAEKYGGNSLFYRGELIGNERTHAESKSIHAMRDAGIYFKTYILIYYKYNLNQNPYSRLSWILTFLPFQTQEKTAAWQHWIDATKYLGRMLQRLPAFMR